MSVSRERKRCLQEAGNEREHQLRLILSSESTAARESRTGLKLFLQIADNLLF